MSFSLTPLPLPLLPFTEGLLRAQHRAGYFTPQPSEGGVSNPVFYND